MCLLYYTQLCTTVSVVYYCIMLCTTYIHYIFTLCVLCYTLHRWLCFSLSAVDYQRSVGELSPTIVQPWVFVQYDQISSYDVTESYNCSNNIHSDDVTCIFRHGRIQGHIYLTQCSFLLRTVAESAISSV